MAIPPGLCLRTTITLMFSQKLILVFFPKVCVVWRQRDRDYDDVVLNDRGHTQQYSGTLQPNTKPGVPANASLFKNLSILY